MTRSRRAALACVAVAATAGCLGYTIESEEGIEDRKNRIDQLQTLADAKNETIDEQDSLLSDRNETIGDLEQDVANLETTVADLEDDLSDLEAELTDKRQELAAAESTIDSKNSEIDTLESDIDDLESEIDTHEAVVEETRTQAIIQLYTYAHSLASAADDRYSTGVEEWNADAHRLAEPYLERSHTYYVAARSAVGDIIETADRLTAPLASGDVDPLRNYADDMSTAAYELARASAAASNDDWADAEDHHTAAVAARDDANAHEPLTPDDLEARL